VFEFGPIGAVRDFLETGGQILPAIALATLAMWALMLERIWYFWRVYPAEAQKVRQLWATRRDHASWYAHQIREELISQMRLKLDHGVGMIKTLVELCPLLGLLGTVTGMIDVFDVMAISGSGNARAMASGVYRATLPTMAGMVAAISGLLLSVQIDRFARQEADRIGDQMTIEQN
jgi:biopolymer transport protein ExbB